MECFHCKHDNPSGAKFCNSCGRQIADKSPDDTKRCVSCGKRMNYDVYFNVCQHCGFAYRISISRPDDARADAPWTRTLLYYISLAVPGVGIIAGGIYMSRHGAMKKLGHTCTVLGVVNLAFVSVVAFCLRSMA